MGSADADSRVRDFNVGNTIVDAYGSALQSVWDEAAVRCDEHRLAGWTAPATVGMLRLSLQCCGSPFDMMLRDLPRWTLAIVIGFWLSTIAADIASFYLDPEVGLGRIDWGHFFIKRTALALFWSAVSIAALVWYRDRPIGAGNLWRSVLFAAPIAAVVCFAYALYFGAWLMLLSHGAVSWWRGAAMMWSPDVLYAYFTVWQIVVAANAFHYYRRLQREQRDSEQLQLKLAQTELMLFRAQLEPHFLFNALNSIASLVRLQRNEAAIDALNQLGTLLRGVLEVGQRQLMPWQWEFEFTGMYVALQKLRFAEKLDVVFDIQDIAASTPVPILILQPLIENAIHHGPLLDAERCEVEVRLRRHAGQLLLEVRNRIGHAVADAHHGLGLGSIAARLKAIYGDRANFTHERRDEMFIASATFPEICNQPGAVAHAPA
jgi:hypothetical protein